MSHFKAEMHQIRFRLGLRPRPHWGALPRPPSWIKGVLVVDLGVDLKSSRLGALGSGRVVFVWGPSRISVGSFVIVQVDLFYYIFYLFILFVYFIIFVLILHVRSVLRQTCSILIRPISCSLDLMAVIVQ